MCVLLSPRYSRPGEYFFCTIFSSYFLPKCSIARPVEWTFAISTTRVFVYRRLCVCNSICTLPRLSRFQLESLGMSVVLGVFCAAGRAFDSLFTSRTVFQQPPNFTTLTKHVHVESGLILRPQPLPEGVETFQPLHRLCHTRVRSGAQPCAPDIDIVPALHPQPASIHIHIQSR